MIWGVATEDAEPQVIRVTTYVTQDIWCSDVDRIFITSTTPCPIPLLVSRESRAVATKYYQPIFPGISVYLDPAKDTIFFQNPEALKRYFDTCIYVDLQHAFATDPQTHFLELGLRRLAIGGFINHGNVNSSNSIKESILLRELLGRMAHLRSFAMQCQGDLSYGHLFKALKINLQNRFIVLLKEEWIAVRKEGLPTVQTFTRGEMEAIADGGMRI
jgi:hypothetical protein